MKDGLRLHLTHERLHRRPIEKLDLVGGDQRLQLRPRIRLRPADRPVNVVAAADQEVSEVATGKPVDAGDQDGLSFSRSPTPPPADE
jgi:hypothetical protein